MTASGKVDVNCPQCKARLAVPVTAMGKSGKCPHCQNIFPLAMPAPRAAAAAPVLAAAPSPSPLTPLGPAPYSDPGFAPLGSADLMPISEAQLAPLSASAGLAPIGGSMFTSSLPQSGYTLQSAAPHPYLPSATLPSNSSLASEYLSNANASYNESRKRKYSSNEGEGWGINAGIGGGAVMMLVALLWFFAIFLLSGGTRIALYPPIMFVIGLIAFFKGIADNFGD